MLYCCVFFFVLCFVGANRVSRGVRLRSVVELPRASTIVPVGDDGTKGFGVGRV